MNEGHDSESLDDDDELDEEALEQASGGTGAAGHELAHTVQQGAGVGSNESITVGASRTISVGTAQKK